MIYRVFLLLVAAVMVSGCAGTSISKYNPFDNEYPLVKSEIREDINKAISKKNALVDILTRAIPAEDLKTKLSEVQLDDRRLIVQSLARQGVMFERAKQALEFGRISKQEFFYIYNLLVEGYVDGKTVLNRYTEYFGPSKMASFVLFEDQISAKGKEIENAFSDLYDGTANKLFNLIMQQTVLMDELFLLAVSR